MIVRILLFLFLFFSAKLEATNFIEEAADWTFTVNDSIDDDKKIPGEWVDLGELETFPGYHELTLNSTIYEGAACKSAQLCAGWTVTASRNNRINYNLSVAFTPQTWTDDNQRIWTVALAWPDGLPQIEIADFNSDSYNHKYTQEYLDAPTTPEYKVATLSGKSQTRCGILLGTCNMALATYFYEGTAKPHLYIKIPENVSQASIDFSSIASKMKNLIQMSVYVYNNSNVGDTKYAYGYPASGSFSIPQRCSLSLSDTQLFFGSIKPGGNNGLQSSLSTVMTTTCTNAPSGTKQYISVKPVNGGTLDEDNNIYVTHKDKQENAAIGIIYSLSENVDCESGNTFDTESLRRTLSGGQNEIYSDNIYFGLCKYGIPFTYGEHKASINIVSRLVTP